MAPLVWLADADAVDADVLAACAAWLGASEQARCARFVRSERRRQFIVGRALLRVALARLTLCAPAAIVLRERAGLAPEFQADPDVFFSISHSGGSVACAAARGVRLGLDIERIDTARDVVELARHAFDAGDVARLLAVDADARHAAFYRMWCAHEARIKLGGPSAAEYPLAAPGLAGVLACGGGPLAAPAFTPVRLDARFMGGA